MAADASTIHASVVLIGAKAVLIRGPSGAGKSRLAWQLLQSALPFTRLVGDDRVHVEARSGRLLVSPSTALAGLIEIRGLGIRRLVHESLAVVGLVVDLSAPDAGRLPPAAAGTTELAGVTLPRLAVAPGCEALQMVFAFLGTSADGG